MMSHSPRVSIGLPVYNGSQYLAETIESLLCQTYPDFELIVSDNGSTDDTESICREYELRDQRIKYLRHDVNRGAAWNYNYVFSRATGEYFRWAAADDLCAPEYLATCVDVLDTDPRVVLAFTRCKAIDENGQILREYPSLYEAGEASTCVRFAAVIVRNQPFIPVFGLTRRSVLAKTKLIGAYAASDRPLVGELALHGRFHEVNDFLFFYRVHPQQSWGSKKTRHEQQAWYDPTRLNKLTFPHWRLLAEHEMSVLRAPIHFNERLQCQYVMVKWVRRRWRYLFNNLLLRDI